ncbi:MAG: OmpP1/FadL family transporter [Myxococcota bacterium]
MRSTRHALRGALVATIVAAAGASPALAAGYDTPILFSARHMGMGGAAIGYVDDGSALFHNPAGLAGIDKGNILGHVGMLIGTLQASPHSNAVSKRSELTVAPMPLVGGGGRVTDWLVIGAGIYPVASAGGSYKYEVGGSELTDETTLVFFEASPGIGINLPGNLKLGLSYRVIYASVERKQDNSFDFKLTGLDGNASRMGEASFPAFRIGLQWDPVDFLKLGLNFRSIAKVDLEDTGDLMFASNEVDKVEGTFTLPAQLGFGARGDFGDFGAVLDVQYTFNSQNGDQDFDFGGSAPIKNINRWSNNVTVRVGGEYRLHPTADATLPIRLGYLLDSQANNPDYPTAFGTPPTHTQSITIGAGWDGGPWEVNLAGAYRFGEVEVDPDPEDFCIPCGKAGDYAMDLFGVYTDFSWDF